MNKFEKLVLAFCCLICLSLLFTACSNKAEQVVPKFQAGLGQAQWKAFGKADSLLNAKLKAQAETQAKEDKKAQDKEGPSDDKEDSQDFEPAQFTTLYDVNMRSGPSTDYDVVELLDANTLVDQTGPEEDGWLPVAAGDTQGYIRKDLLTPASEMPASVKP